MDNLQNKTILTVACTGGGPKKTDTPYIPLQPREIADEVIACAEAGASIAHIHVRDDQDNPSMSFEKFRETVGYIREAQCPILLNLTTSGGLDIADDVRQKPFLELRPELASFDCGTMNWQHRGIFENSPRFLESTAQAMESVGVKPEIEIFDTSWVNNALYYIKKGFLKGPQHFQFVLGAPNGMTATIENLCYLVRMIPAGHTWAALGIGQGHLPILAAAIAMGGHVRVGMEDNILYSKGVLAKSNVEFVARAKRLAAELGKSIATPDEARQILGLPPKA